MNEPLMIAAQELRRQLQALASKILEDGRIAEMRKLLVGLNTLEDLNDQPKTTLASVFDFGDSAESGQEVYVGPDEFFGLMPLDAAKRYLRKVGGTSQNSAKFQEIIAAIKTGGGDPGSEEKLERSLARSTWDIVKIGEDRFGLLEFFPHVRRGKKKNGVVKDTAIGLGEPSAEDESDSPDSAATIAE